MAANSATRSFSSSSTLLYHKQPLLGVGYSKRFVSFSALPYPSFSSRHNTSIVENEEEQPWKKLGNPAQVYVCNLPRSCDTQHLLHLFTPHGTVLSTEVCRNAETGESKGSAYVTMGSYNAAKNALAALDGSDVGGREMRVKFSVEMNTKNRNLETLNSPPVRRTIYYEGPHKVYVGNLAKYATPEDVRHLFGKFGNVASVRVLQDFKQGKSRVYAFVSYLSQRERDASMSLNGTEFCGRTLVVREGVEKTGT